MKTEIKWKEIKIKWKYNKIVYCPKYELYNIFSYNFTFLVSFLVKHSFTS